LAPAIPRISFSAIVSQNAATAQPLRFGLGHPLHQRKRALAGREKGFADELHP